MKTLHNSYSVNAPCKRPTASTYPSYPNFAIITSTSWKIRAKNPNIREVDYGNTPCYSGTAASDMDRHYSRMQKQRYENKVNNLRPNEPLFRFTMSHHSGHNEPLVL